MRFRTKLNLGMSSIIIALSLTLAILVTHIATRVLAHETKRRGQVLTENIALRAASYMLSSNVLMLKEIVTELQTVDHDIAYAFLIDESGQIPAHTFAKAFPAPLKYANIITSNGEPSIRLFETDTDTIYDFAVPVRIGAHIIGQARLGLSCKQVHFIVGRLIFFISIVTAITLLISVWASTHFAHRITYRLGLLGDYAKNMARGELKLRETSKSDHHCQEISKAGQPSCPTCCTATRAYPHYDETHGMDCGRHQSMQDLKSCTRCSVVAKNSGDEIYELAETFKVMSQSLRRHIAELEATQTSLTHQQEILHTILESSPDQVALFDQHGVFVSTNLAFASFAGKSKEMIIGRKEKDVSFPLKTPESQQETENILRHGLPVNKELQIVMPDGSRKWFHIAKVPVHDKNKRSIGVLSTARDITDVKDYQNQLIHLQKLESIGKLAGGVAHEINTPLGIILGYSQLLQEDFPASEQVHQDLVIIEKQAKFCRKIVADLLNFSRQTKSEKKELCFNNSIMEVAQLVRHGFKLDNVDIVTNLDDRLPIVWGTPEQLKQVWMNLISNAVEAIGYKGVIRIKTELDTSEETITAWFIDSGTGIASTDIDSIFDPFFSTKPVGKGTGLGLSVSFGIIKDHGGQISVISPVPAELLTLASDSLCEHGPGTAFKVVLPLDNSVRI